jgi:hypothetical protein
MGSILRFIGSPQPLETPRLKSITNSLKKDISGSLNVTRNWRTGLELQELIKVDQACKHFYQTGYYSSVTTRAAAAVKKEGDEYDQQGVGGADGGNNENEYNPV